MMLLTNVEIVNVGSEYNNNGKLSSFINNNLEAF